MKETGQGGPESERLISRVTSSLLRSIPSSDLVCLVVVVVVGLGWWSVNAMFRGFSGGSCIDTDERVLPSPDGKRTVKCSRRVCGSKYVSDVVYLSSAKPKAEYDYVTVMELSDVAPGQMSVTWDGPDQISVTYPESAQVGDVYAKVRGVRVVLHPALPQVTGAR